MARGASLTSAETQRIRELMQQSARNVQQRPSRVKSAPKVTTPSSDDAGEGRTIDEPATVEDAALNFADVYSQSTVGMASEISPDVALKDANNPMLKVSSAAELQSSPRLDQDAPGQPSYLEPSKSGASAIAPSTISTTESSAACESPQHVPRSRPNVSLKTAASVVLAANKIKRNASAASSAPQLFLKTDMLEVNENPPCEDEAGIWASIIDTIDHFFEVQFLKLCFV